MHISLDMPQKNINNSADSEAFSEMGIVTTSELGNEVVVVANVYSGSRDTQVEMQLDNREPVNMTWNQDQRDPWRSACN